MRCLEICYLRKMAGGLKAWGSCSIGLAVGHDEQSPVVTVILPCFASVVSYSSCSWSGGSECHLLGILIHFAPFIPSYFVLREASLLHCCVEDHVTPLGSCLWVDSYNSTGPVNCWPACVAVPIWMVGIQHFPPLVLTNPDYPAVMRQVTLLV